MAATAFGQGENFVCSVTATNDDNTTYYQNFTDAADADGVSTLTYDLIADGDDSNAGANMVPAATAVLLSIDPSTAAATGDEASAAKTVSFTATLRRLPRATCSTAMTIATSPKAATSTTS